MRRLWSKCPEDMGRDRQLTRNDFRVYHELDLLSGKRGWWTGSQDDIAGRAGLCRRVVCRSVSKLRKLGYISTEKRGGWLKYRVAMRESGAEDGTETDHQSKQLNTGMGAESVKMSKQLSSNFASNGETMLAQGCVNSVPHTIDLHIDLPSEDDLTRTVNLSDQLTPTDDQDKQLTVSTAEVHAILGTLPVVFEVGVPERYDLHCPPILTQLDLADLLEFLKRIDDARRNLVALFGHSPAAPLVIPSPARWRRLALLAHWYVQSVPPRRLYTQDGIRAVYDGDSARIMESSLADVLYHVADRSEEFSRGIEESMKVIG